MSTTLTVGPVQHVTSTILLVTLVWVALRTAQSYVAGRVLLGRREIAVTTLLVLSGSTVFATILWQDPEFWVTADTPEKRAIALGCAFALVVVPTTIFAVAAGLLIGTFVGPVERHLRRARER